MKAFPGTVVHIPVANSDFLIIILTSCLWCLFCCYVPPPLLNVSCLRIDGCVMDLRVHDIWYKTRQRVDC